MPVRIPRTSDYPHPSKADSPLDDFRVCVLPDQRGHGSIRFGTGTGSDAWIGAVAGLALAAIGILIMEQLVDVHFGGRTMISLTAMLVLVGATIGAYWGSRLARRRATIQTSCNDDTYRPRVTCFAYQGDLPLFASVGGYTFEPVLVAGKFALLNARLSKAITRYGIELLLAMVCVTAMISATRHLWMWLAILLLAAVLYLPVAIRPCYLRISPGLLEVLVGSWRHPRTRVEKSLSLNQLHITIRLDTGVVDFRVNPADKKSVARLGLAAFANPAEVAAQIARGAVAPGTGAATAKHALCG